MSRAELHNNDYSTFAQSRRKAKLTTSAYSVCEKTVTSLKDIRNDESRKLRWKGQENVTNITTLFEVTTMYLVTKHVFR